MPTKVQSGAGDDGLTTGTASTYTFTFPQASTAGNLLVAVVCASGGTTDTFTTPAGWTLAGSLSQSGGSFSYLLVYYIANNAGGITSIKATAATAQWTFAIAMEEWSGIATTSPVDGTAGTATVSTTGTSVSASTTTTNANDLILGLLALDTGWAGVTETITTPSTGYAQDINHAPSTCLAGVGVASKVVSATGTQTVQENWGTAAPGSIMVIAFKASGSTISSGVVDVGGGPMGLANVATAQTQPSGIVDMGGSDGLGSGFVMGGAGGLAGVVSKALCLATLGGSGGLQIPSTIALVQSSLGSNGGGVSASSLALAGMDMFGGSGGLMIIPTPHATFGGSGGLSSPIIAGIYLPVGRVKMGTPNVPGGGLQHFIDAHVGYPGGHWAYVVVWIWRDHPLGSGTNFGWNPCPVAVWRGGPTNWKQLTT